MSVNNNTYRMDKESLCNGCEYLDFKNRCCKKNSITENISVLNNKKFQHKNYAELNTFTNSTGFVSIIRDKNCVGYTSKIKNKQEKKG